MKNFSADATIFSKNFKLFFLLQTWKNHPQKLLIISPHFFQYCQPAQNQPKSHFLFHKNISLRDFYTMTHFVYDNFSQITLKRKTWIVKFFRKDLYHYYIIEYNSLKSYPVSEYLTSLSGLIWRTRTLVEMLTKQRKS